MVEIREITLAEYTDNLRDSSSDHINEYKKTGCLFELGMGQACWEIAFELEDSPPVCITQILD